MFLSFICANLDDLNLRAMGYTDHDERQLTKKSLEETPCAGDMGWENVVVDVQWRLSTREVGHG